MKNISKNHKKIPSVGTFELFFIMHWSNDSIAVFAITSHFPKSLVSLKGSLAALLQTLGIAPGGDTPAGEH